MRPTRILLLVIAIVAGGLAAYLATRGSAPVTVVEQAATPAPAPQLATKVLVAKKPIGVGERLSAAAVEWQPWPENAIRPEYITVAKSPDAPTQIAGAVARFEIFEGEPILDAKLVHSNQGFLSAVLEPGMRGVSINVSAASGSGGFIIPNDRVDVVLTDNGQGQTTSRVLLSDVKVLAIGTRLGQTGATGAPPDPNDPKSQIFTSDVIATVELTPQQADTLINATSQGKISLVLRSVADFGKAAQAGPIQAAAGSDSQTVKIIRFGRAASVTPGNDQQQNAPATVAPAAYVPPAMPVTPAAVTTTTVVPQLTNPTTTTTVTTDAVQPPTQVLVNPPPLEQPVVQ